MKLKLSLSVLLFISLNITTFSQATTHIGSSQKGKYKVDVYQSDMGGGGYITGIVQDSNNPAILYARSDVAGVFKSTTGGRSWVPINNGLDKMSDHYCHSLAMNPFDNQHLLRASGDVRSFKFIGRIHRSTDGGKSWHLVKDGLDYYGNGPTRVYGELIAYNPDKKGEVAAGSYSKGLWISHDNGSTWKYSGLKNERIACVKFYNNRMYVGTISDNALAETSQNPKEASERLSTLQDFPRGNIARLYTSDNHGKSWNVLYEKEGIAVNEIIITDNGKRILFASSFGIYKSTDNGKTFSIIPELPEKSSYRTLVQSTLEPNVFYTAEKHWENTAVPIYKSTDKGETWYLISPKCLPEQLSLFPSWHGNDPTRVGSAISHILPDNRDANKLYISNWWGVTTTDDLGKSYKGYNFAGIGIICCEALQAHPTLKNTLVAGVCDHAPTISVDGGKHFITAECKKGPARVICLSKRNPSLLIFGTGRKGKSNKIYRSTDFGKTISLVFVGTEKEFIQDIKEDPYTPKLFWAYVEGNINERAGIYQSKDEGITWSKIECNPFSHLTTLPQEEFKIDRDLTPIVNYQYKNGCGTSQMITFDAQQAGTIYVGEWTEGIFRSTNNGMSWEKIGKKLPFDTKRNHILQFIYAHPYEKGVLYAGFWNTGLWKSTDFGNTWHAVSVQKEKQMNASSLSISKTKEGKTLMALGCSNHPLGDTPTKLFISNDGEKWTNIYDHTTGCLRFISIVADATENRIYAATAGTGIFFYNIQEK